jgi:hypothetical protein
MTNSKSQQAINFLKSVFEQHVSKGTYDLHVSDLLPADRANYDRREGELHPSSFPFCGLRYAYELEHRDADPVIRQDFGRDYYLPAGTVFHSAIQKWLGRSGTILGDWKCLHCGRTHKLQTKPDACRKCKGTHLEYHELGGSYGKNLHWHTDGVLKTEDIGNWVIDYKSTSTFAIDQHRKTQNLFPYSSNRFQIETYIPLIEKTYELPIAGWLLVYAARDSPSSYKLVVVGSAVSQKQKDALLLRLDTADRDWSVARKVLTKPIAVYKRLAQSKLCADKDYYDMVVHDKYSPCPLSKVCFGSKLHAKLHGNASKKE